MTNRLTLQAKAKFSGTATERTVLSPLQAPLGATETKEGWSFLLWAPRAKKAEIHFVTPQEETVRMDSAGEGYFTALVPTAKAGMRYFFNLNGGGDLPDPCSRYQPEGVHGPSELVSGEFDWTDETWRGVPFSDYIIYELHVGTFSEAGTFEGVIPQLRRLKELGVTAVEIMPVAQFPGGRNWGYDGVDLFAVQNSYGGPVGLKRLVDACHAHGLAVVLDVVYNHLGPEGNYLDQFGPYFTDAYRTPWGRAINFDGPESDQVRRFFLENALYWQTEFHMDALRLDAVHAIRDFSATPFLQELARATKAQRDITGRPFYLIAESDLNNPRVITPEVGGGIGLDAQWSDDFHHCLHVLLTGEQSGYYQDYAGVTQFAKVFREGYAFTGDYSVNRKARHGAPAKLAIPRQFVVCSQNHDQVGNRMTGDRLTASLDFESLKLAAGAVMLSPFTPMLFMGEEYGEKAPFQYMSSHSDPQLVEAVRKGRKEEFASFQWAGEVPDPQAESTFINSKLNTKLIEMEPHRTLHNFYAALAKIRKALLLSSLEKEEVMALPNDGQQVLMVVYRPKFRRQMMLLMNFSREPQEVAFPFTSERWQKRMDSASPEWGGPGELLPERLEVNTSQLKLAARSVALFEQVEA